MFEKIEIFRIAHALASHAGARQAVVAQNLANADTPGYAAREVQPFQELMDNRDAGFGMQATRARHLNGVSAYGGVDISERRHAAGDPNGNSVSLEEEMLKAVDINREHDRALAIYKSSLTILRASIGRR